MTNGDCKRVVVANEPAARASADKLTPLSQLNPIFRVLSRLTAEKMMEVRARTSRGRSASLDYR